jgi:hypothetical protein
MAFTMAKWRDSITRHALLRSLAERITPAQGLYLVRQMIRICCGWHVADGDEWRFIDGDFAYDLSMHWTSHRPAPTWNSPQALETASNQMVNFARIRAARHLDDFDAVTRSLRGSRAVGYSRSERDLEREQLPTPNDAQLRMNQFLRSVILDVFPDDPSLELGAEVVNDSAFPSIVTSALDGCGVFADWIRDRGQDACADHLLKNTTGATPWWLRQEVCALELTQ